jgi:hypothetical protein
MVAMKRDKEFKDAYKEIKVRDSRFGNRKFYLTSKESPSIGGIYAAPGRGQAGEHQN